MSHRLRWTWLTVLGLLLAAPACVPEQTQDDGLIVDDDGTSETDATRDTGGVPTDPDHEDTGRIGPDGDAGGLSDTRHSRGDDTSECSGDRVECNGECVDLNASDAHCGMCGNACASGAGCQGGECICPEGQKLCEGGCVDITANDDHCGDCSSTCSGPRSCRERQCQCPSGTSYCSGECVDTTSNPDHCGACGMSCRSGEMCQQSSCQPASKVQMVISETNDVRSTQTDCGSEGVKSAAPSLQGNRELHRAAQAHADDMAMNDFISHTGSDGSDFATRIRRTNFSGNPVAENVAAGNSSASATVQQWVDSDGHCKNLMLQRANRIGVGVANNPMSTYGWYWVQVFGSE